MTCTNATPAPAYATVRWAYAVRRWDGDAVACEFRPIETVDGRDVIGDTRFTYDARKGWASGFVIGGEYAVSRDPAKEGHVIVTAGANAPTFVRRCPAAEPHVARLVNGQVRW